MKERLVSRRALVVGSTATAALMASGVLSMQNWLGSPPLAMAAENDANDNEEKVVATTCNACTNKCGLFAHVRDGRLWKLTGNSAHPYSKGTLCARGHGFSQIVYSQDRLTSPLKRNADGSFSAISWDQAFSEIGDKLKAIIAENGPESVSIATDPRPNGAYYCARFIQALGSPNYFTHNATCNGSLAAGYTATTGASNFSADIANSKMVLFIGRSYADGVRPSSVLTLADAAERGAKIVVVDPRLNNSGIFASQWLPINPGTDLALLLAIANVMVSADLYNHDFVDNYSVGLEDWLPTLSTYTPEWAAPITGIDADTITTLAKDLAAAGKQGVVEQGWRGAFGCQYRNSFEAARCITAINALLGNYNQKGGAMLYPSSSFGSLDEQKFPKVPTVDAKKAGLKEYPLQSSGQGIVSIIPAKAKEGSMKAVFFYNSNAAKAYSNPTAWADGMDNMDLKVCIDVQMSETALLCDYVLAECTYLERAEVPQIDDGKQPQIEGRFQALDKVHPDTKPSDEIFAGLAQAAGIGQYFDFTCDELTHAQLESIGVSYDELSEKGVVSFGKAWDGLGTPPSFKTPSGMFEFASQKIANTAGLSLHQPTITWIEPKVMPGKDNFRLIGGKQSIHSHTMTTSIEALMDITREYHLERIWIPASRAADLGIEEGDLVEVSNDLYTGQVEAHVTERLNPTCVWIPTHYGGSSPYLTQGMGVGIPHMEYVPFDFEDEVGPAMTHETLVSVKKVNA